MSDHLPDHWLPEQPAPLHAHEGVLQHSDLIQFQVSCVKFKLETKISQVSLVSSIRVDTNPDDRDSRGLQNVAL